MPKNGHTEGKIVAVLRQVEAGLRQGGDQPRDVLHGGQSVEYDGNDIFGLHQKLASSHIGPPC